MCANYLEYDGLVYGQFFCPIEGFNYEDTKCCGPSKEQYCCSVEEYNYQQNMLYRNEWNGDERKKSNDNVLFGWLVTIPFLLFFIGTIAFLILLLRMRKKKDEKTDADEEGKTVKEQGGKNGLTESEKLNKNDESDVEN
jgi:hypothetical protein